MIFDEVDRIKEREKKRVGNIISEGRKNGLKDNQILTILADILAETSSDTILAERAATRREVDYRQQLERLDRAHKTFVQERKEIIEMLTKEGFYYPETEEDKALPFWISGLLARIYNEEKK